MDLFLSLRRRVLDSTHICLVHRGSYNAVSRHVLVHRLHRGLTRRNGSDAGRIAEASRLVRRSHASVQLFTNTLFLPHIFILLSSLLIFLFSRLFLNLLLKCILHFLRLRFSFVQQNSLLITTAKNTALLLQLHVGSILSNAAAYFEIGEVVLRLHWRILRLVKRLLLIHELLLLLNGHHLTVHGLMRILHGR